MDERTLWIVVPVAREMLPDLLKGVQASMIRLEKNPTSDRAYDLIVTAPADEPSRKGSPDE